MTEAHERGGPYETIEDIPEIVRDDLPDEALEIYREAYQEAWEGYTEEEGGELGQHAVAHRVGMTAVENEYALDEDTGEWLSREEAPERESEEDESFGDVVDDAVEDLIP